MALGGPKGCPAMAGALLAKSTTRSNAQLLGLEDISESKTAPVQFDFDGIGEAASNNKANRRYMLCMRQNPGPGRSAVPEWDNLAFDLTYALGYMFVTDLNIFAFHTSSVRSKQFITQRITASKMRVASTMSGKGAVRLGQGTIQGLDLNTLMGSGKGSVGTTVFDSLGTTFTMTAGNLNNDDLLFVLPNYEARGKGRIGLGAQDIDYLFTSSALRANSGKGLAIPVSIKGSWSDPRIRPDLEAAINLNLAEQKAKELEDEAKARAQQKLKEKLGVVTQDGQSVEDAVKGKVEDKLKGQLLKLFD